MEGFLIFFAIAAIVVTIFVFSWLSRKWRREAMEKLAADLGLPFSADDDGRAGQYRSLEFFQKGHGQTARNLIVGDAAGIELCLMDYEYTTGSGKNRTTHYQTVLVLRSELLDLPHCTLRQQHAFDFFGKLLGFQDIDFEEDSGFSSAFVLQGEDESAVRALFGPAVREWFIEHKCNAKKPFSFEAKGPLVLYHQSRQFRPEEVQDVLNLVFGLLPLLSEDAASTE